MLIDLIGLPLCWLHASAMPRHAARLDAGPYVLARHTMAVQLWVRQSTPGPRIFYVNVGRQLPLLCEHGLRTALCRNRRAPSNLVCLAFIDHPVFLFSCGCLAGTRVPRADSDEIVEWRNFWSTCRHFRQCSVCLVGFRPAQCQLFHLPAGVRKTVGDWRGTWQIASSSFLPSFRTREVAPLFGRKFTRNSSSLPFATRLTRL